VSQTSKRELLPEIRPRYTLCNRSAKQRILDELVVITGYHRKYAIQLLNHPPKRRTCTRPASPCENMAGPWRSPAERLGERSFSEAGSWGQEARWRSGRCVVLAPNAGTNAICLPPN
jgi:hypothetical protein